MIDIHSHIAWGIDDGIPSYQQAKIAFECAKESSINTICSTPHFVPGQLNKERVKEIRSRQKETKELGSQYGIQVVFGAEMFMNYEFPKCLNEELYFTMNDTKYLLCEFDVRKDIHDIDDYNESLYEIEVRDMTPLIAHVERYFQSELDYKILDEWKERGYVFQVNRTSLQGLHGPRIQKNAWNLLEKGYCHVIATDAHRGEGHRIERLDDIYLEVEKKYGKEYANLVFKENPDRILNNKEIISKKPKKAHRWSIFKR